ncbi:MAG: hypothetical protein ABJH04_07445 [Cyclobacteriaceae bacterium]
MTVELKDINAKPKLGMFTAELHIMNLPCAYVIYSPSITLVDPFPGCNEILDELAQQEGLKDFTVYVRELFNTYADSKFNGSLNVDSNNGFIIMNTDCQQYSLYHIPGFKSLPDQTKLELERKIAKALPANTFIFNSLRPTDGV